MQFGGLGEGLPTYHPVFGTPHQYAPDHELIPVVPIQVEEIQRSGVFLDDQVHGIKGGLAEVLTELPICGLGLGELSQLRGLVQPAGDTLLHVELLLITQHPLLVADYDLAQVGRLGGPVTVDRPRELVLVHVKSV